MRASQRASQALRQLRPKTPSLPLRRGLRSNQVEAFSPQQDGCRQELGIYTQSSCRIFSSRQHSTDAVSSEAARRFDLDIPLRDTDAVKTKTVSILPTPKANPEKLSERLKALLLDGSWNLESPGDAIYTVRSFSQREDAENASSQIMNLADKQNHHPHLSHFQCAVGDDGASDTTQLILITCTTHQPRGLGLRDVSLAKAIDEVLSPYDNGQREAHFIKGAENDSSRDNAVTSFREMLLEQRNKHRSEIDCAVCKK